MLTSSRRRRTLVTAALPLLLGLALLGVPPVGASGVAPQHAALATTVTVTPRAPMVGERTAFSGRLAGAGRPVTLQRRTASGWKVVAKTRVSSARTYRLVVSVTKNGTYRVRARAAAGRPRFTSARIAVKVVRQAAAIQAVDAPFVVGIARSVTAKVVPARNGRVVVLQKYVGGAWANVANARSNALGIVKINYAAPAPGLASYRVVGARFNGSAVIASAHQAHRTARATELLSAGTVDGDEAFNPSISADGRWVTFTAESQLLPSDTDAQNDVYLFDRRTGALTLLLPAANSHTNSAVLSANGRYVVLQSLATNLAGEANSDYDVFVLDRTTGVVDLISRTAGGLPASGNSYAYDISDDGRFVAFTSTADDLVSSPPPDTSVRHAYVHDRTTHTNRGLDRIGLGWADSNIYGVSLSGDGSAVAFQNGDVDLDPGNVDGTAIFRWTIDSNGIMDNRTNLTPDVNAHSPALDSTGDLLAFTAAEAVIMNDTNNVDDVYLRTAAGTYVLASPFGSGESEGASISGDGRYIALTTKSVQPGDTNGTGGDIVVWDRAAGTHRLVTKGGAGYSGEAHLSANGSVLALASTADGLAPGSTGNYNVFAAVLR